MSKGCNHKWQDFGAYKKCLVCGQIMMSSKMAAIQGIVSEVEDCEDEVGHTVLPPQNDTND